MSVNTYKLKSGQLNFQSEKHSSSYSCVVIKDGEFHNLSEDQRLILIELLNKHNEPKQVEHSIEDMF